MIHAFYHRNALNRANLKPMFIDSDTSPVFPKRGTRWADHTFQALKNFEQGYTAIVTHLEKIARKQYLFSNEFQKAVASGISRKMTNISIMKYVMKLLAVLSILSKLSKALQDWNVHIANVQDSISSTIQL